MLLAAIATDVAPTKGVRGQHGDARVTVAYTAAPDFTAA